MTLEGSLVLNGGVAVQVVEIDMQVTVPGILTQIRSDQFPRRIMHTGWYALTVLGNPPPFSAPLTDYVSHHRYLEFEQQADIAPTGAQWWGDKIIWHLAPGVTVVGAVYW